jgi:hypothetical protein
MSDSKRFIRPAISALIIAATVLGLYNVYSDNTEVLVMAKQTACSGAPECEASIATQGRHAFWQSFTFRTNVKGQATVDVRCKRWLYLLGSYTCEKR